MNSDPPRTLNSNIGPTYKFHFAWTEGISDVEWETYHAAMSGLREAGIDFMLGGGFALAAFTGRWRNTKDIDLYILPKHRERAAQLITQAGLKDFHSRLAYDRSWIYRGHREDTIVDLIWAMANGRAEVDPIWFARAGQADLRGFPVKIAPIEEFLWCKLYIVQRDRCDWVDGMNLLFAQPGGLDWAHLLWRLGEDWPLLQGLLTLYGWLYPEAADRLRERLPEPLKIPAGLGGGARPWEERVRLLDSRRWFGGMVPQGERLEI